MCIKNTSDLYRIYVYVQIYRCYTYIHTYYKIHIILQLCNINTLNKIWKVNSVWNTKYKNILFLCILSAVKLHCKWYQRKRWSVMLFRLIILQCLYMLPFYMLIKMFDFYISVLASTAIWFKQCSSKCCLLIDHSSVTWGICCVVMSWTWNYFWQNTNQRLLSVCTIKQYCIPDTI